MIKHEANSAGCQLRFNYMCLFCGHLANHYNWYPNAPEISGIELDKLDDQQLHVMSRILSKCDECSQMDTSGFAGMIEQVLRMRRNFPEASGQFANVPEGVDIYDDDYFEDTYVGRGEIP